MFSYYKNNNIYLEDKKPVDDISKMEKNEYEITRLKNNIKSNNKNISELTVILNDIKTTTENIDVENKKLSTDNLVKVFSEYTFMYNKKLSLNKELNIICKK